MITVMIPTMNRSDFLVRLLDYFAEMGFAGRVAIADASGPEHLAVARAAVERLGRTLDLVHHSVPAVGIAVSIAMLCENITTPYVTLCPDDDFIVPSTMMRCVEFLDAHPDYVAARGVGILLVLDKPGAVGKCLRAGPYALPTRLEDTAADRVRNYLRDYGVSLFSIHRADAWRRMWAPSGIEDTAFSAEILPCALGIAHGKLGEVDGLYLVRQVHEQRYELPDLFDWLTAPGWNADWRTVAAQLCDEIALVDGVERTVAEEAVRLGMWGHLAGGLSTKFAQRSELSPAKRLAFNISRVTRRVPGGMSLQGLKMPGSPYRKDFLEVLDAVEGRMTGTETR